jgi:hypothetical protein
LSIRVSQPPATLSNTEFLPHKEEEEEKVTVSNPTFSLFIERADKKSRAAEKAYEDSL